MIFKIVQLYCLYFYCSNEYLLYCYIGCISFYNCPQKQFRQKNTRTKNSHYSFHNSLYSPHNSPHSPHNSPHFPYNSPYSPYNSPNSPFNSPHSLLSMLTLIAKSWLASQISHAIFNSIENGERISLSYWWMITNGS